MNALDDKQETALMKACRISAINFSRGDKRYLDDYTNLIMDLIEAGAKPAIINKAGKTALQIAQTEDPRSQNKTGNS